MCMHVSVWFRVSLCAYSCVRQSLCAFAVLFQHALSALASRQMSVYVLAWLFFFFKVL